MKNESNEAVGIVYGHYEAVRPSKITGRRYKGTKSEDSTRSSWRTPDWLFEYLDRHYGPFDIDLAACESSKKCTFYYSKEDDSLYKDWTSHEKMFLNPPYDDILPWADKALTTMNLSKELGIGRTIVMVLPDDNSTAWYRRSLAASCEVINIISDGKSSGRLAFIDAGTGVAVKGNNKGTIIFICQSLKPHGINKTKTKYISITEMMQDEDDG